MLLESFSPLRSSFCQTIFGKYAPSGVWFDCCFHQWDLSMILCIVEIPMQAKIVLREFLRKKMFIGCEFSVVSGGGGADLGFLSPFRLPLFSPSLFLSFCLLPFFSLLCTGGYIQTARACTCTLSFSLSSSVSFSFFFFSSLPGSTPIKNQETQAGDFLKGTPGDGILQCNSHSTCQFSSSFKATPQGKRCLDRMGAI